MIVEPGLRRTGGQNATLQNAAGWIAHVEFRQPPGRSEAGQHRHRPQPGQERQNATAVAIMAKRDARSPHTVYISLEDGGLIEPPVRVAENQPFRPAQPLDETSHGRGIIVGRKIAGTLGHGQRRCEAFGIKVGFHDLVAGCTQSGYRGTMNGGGEALRQWMGEYRLYTHRGTIAWRPVHDTLQR